LVAVFCCVKSGDQAVPEITVDRIDIEPGWCLFNANDEAPPPAENCRSTCTIHFWNGQCGTRNSPCGLFCRLCKALDSDGISCFATPTEEEFETKIEASREFLADGGKPSRLPNANQLWMLVGFELFRILKHRYERIETYPQAIVSALKCASRHKSTAEGLHSQLDEAARLIGVTTTALRAKLLAMGFGSAHDRLDASLSAYVASLDEKNRKAFGGPPYDAIWVPDASPMAKPGVLK
jgi:hypothetical protein